jgi:hypothetical protein
MKPLIYVKQSAINALASLLADGSTFERIKATVIRVEDPKLSGAEKKQAVLDELKVIGVNVGGWLLNLIIELCVAWLRLQTTSNK